MQLLLYKSYSLQRALIRIVVLRRAIYIKLLRTKVQNPMGKDIQMRMDFQAVSSISSVVKNSTLTQFFIQFSYKQAQIHHAQSYILVLGKKK